MINSRPWHVVLAMPIVLACFSGEANAKLWYYNDRNHRDEQPKFYDSIDAYCAAFASSFSSSTLSFITNAGQRRCFFFDPSTANDPEQWSAMSAAVVNCADPNSSPKFISYWDLPSCPCNGGYKRDSSSPSMCVENAPPEPPTDQKCDDGLFSGNPILPATAEKYRSETDWADSGPAPLSLERIYRSNWASYIARPFAGLGAVWTHNHGVQLAMTPLLAPTTAAIVMPDGSRRTFAKPSGTSVWAAKDNADSLVQGPGDTWTYKRADDDTSWVFDSTGRLQTKSERNGWTTTYSHDGLGRLSAVTNPFGRTLSFAYDSAGQLDTVTTPEARVLRYQYDSVGRLSSVGEEAVSVIDWDRDIALVVIRVGGGAGGFGHQNGQGKSGVPLGRDRLRFGRADGTSHQCGQASSNVPGGVGPDMVAYDRVLLELGRTSAGMAAGAAATGSVVFEGFYDWAIIAQALAHASSPENCSWKR